MSENSEKNRRPMISAVTLCEKYLELSSGAKADLKRAVSLEKLQSTGTFIRLLDGNEKFVQYSRVVFILPWLSHKEGISLGSVLYSGYAGHSISEARMVQMLRSDYPQDIITLRRMIWHAAGRHAEVTVDWEKLGEQLYYWGERNKQKIVQDYYLAEVRSKKNEGE